MRPATTPTLPLLRRRPQRGCLRRRPRFIQSRLALFRSGPSRYPHRRSAAVDALLTLILACSVHLDDSLVQSLAYKLSLGNQYFVGDLTTLQTYDGAKSAAEARR